VLRYLFASRAIFSVAEAAHAEPPKATTAASDRKSWDVRGWILGIVQPLKDGPEIYINHMFYVLCLK